jgi:hypothetical protein
MTINRKWEQLLEFIVNDESDKARELFHEIVVAESRSIYADLLESEVDDMSDEPVDGSDVESFIDEVDAEEHNTLEDAGEALEDGDEEEPSDDMDMDVDAEAGDDMDMDAGDDVDADADMDVDAEEGDEDMEDRVADLESALDELKKEFDDLMGEEENEPEHADLGMDDDSGEMDMDMDHSDDMGDEMDEMNLAEGVEMTKVPAVSNSESGVNSKSVVAKKNDFGGKSVKFDQGGEEKGGKVSAPSQHMGQAKYRNSAGGKNVSMETAPKAQTKEPAGVMSKPVLGK